MGLTLREFIGEALSQIVLGINDAKEKVKSAGNEPNWVSPPVLIAKAESRETSDSIVYWTGKPSPDHRGMAQIVRFDVAVHASEVGEGGAGIQVSTGFLKAKAGGDVTAEEKSVSRIAFSIPLVVSPPVREQDLDRSG